MSIDLYLKQSYHEYGLNEIDDIFGFLQRWHPNISRLKLLIHVNENPDYISDCIMVVIDLLPLISKVLQEFKNLHKNGLFVLFIIDNMLLIDNFESMIYCLSSSIPINNITLDISMANGFKFAVRKMQNSYNHFNFQHLTKSTSDTAKLFTALHKFPNPHTEIILFHFKESLHIECVLKLNLSFVRKLEIQCFELYTSDLLKICQACPEMYSLKITLDPENLVDLQSLREELMNFCPLITWFEYKSSIFMKILIYV